MIKPIPRYEPRKIYITDDLRTKYKDFGKGIQPRKKKKPSQEQRKIFKYNRSRSFLKSEEWKKLRFEVIVKYGRTCMACGRKAPDVIIHVDHIKPRCQFPELALDFDNLQILCALCNAGKGFEIEVDLRPNQEEPDFLTDAASLG